MAPGDLQEVNVRKFGDTGAMTQGHMLETVLKPNVTG